MAVLSPVLFPAADRGLRLGPDLPLEVLEDRAGTLGVDEVAALPESAFRRIHTPLSEGYTRSVYWLKVDAPPPVPTSPLTGDALLWLEALPAHLNRVTLYQRRADGWREHTSGSTIPMSQRVGIRQLLFPVQPGEPLLLRVQATSAAYVNARFWRTSGLLTALSRTEWSSGAHLGINLALALLIGGAALGLRTRSLTAAAVLTFVVLAHTLSTRGYTLVWLPDAMAPWFDVVVRLGVFALPAAFSWQARELFTRGTAWRRTDRLMVAHALALLAAMLVAPTDLYQRWTWFAVFSPWLTASLCTMVAWTNMARRGVTVVRLLMATPYTLHALLGLHVASTYTGLVSSVVEADVYWQAEALLLLIMIAVALGANLVARFQYAQRRQDQLMHALAHSEQALDERVRLRTAELLQAQNTLQAALDSERRMREEQRQFFNMINHEFRTPLQVMDSAATEQITFPSPDLAPQVERAAQIRRACRRLSTLVDNCLISDRLDTPAFRLQLDHAPMGELIDDAAQLAQWSPRHQLRLDVARAPAEWECDPMLVRIALSNLVDNAVKYGQPGTISLTAHTDERGSLRLSVGDEGPGLPPGAAEHLFQRGQRGDHRARGFGLGLWVARRIALLHGGSIEVAATPEGGACFTLVLPAQVPLEEHGSPLAGLAA
ncbi:ATP-binding protein [Ottowia sp.]|uniref:sensor histidine kinase n=1 Tax=Ottowia sp. TaxID=1898956 RepID=UPI0039E51D90